MTPLEEKLAQLERLPLERARQEEERKAREWLEAEQRAREQELEMELEVLQLEEEEEQKRREETEKKWKEEMEKRAAEISRRKVERSWAVMSAVSVCLLNHANNDLSSQAARHTQLSML